MNHIEESIKAFITKEFLHGDPGQALNENLVHSGIIDSLGILTLINFLEQQFNAAIEPEDVVLENFETIQDICNLVQLRTT